MSWRGPTCHDRAGPAPAVLHKDILRSMQKAGRLQVGAEQESSPSSLSVAAAGPPSFTGAFSLSASFPAHAASCPPFSGAPSRRSFSSSSETASAPSPLAVLAALGAAAASESAASLPSSSSVASSAMHFLGAALRVLRAFLAAMGPSELHSGSSAHTQ